MARPIMPSMGSSGLLKFAEKPVVSAKVWTDEEQNGDF
jgi:hypothetical protein